MGLILALLLIVAAGMEGFRRAEGLDYPEALYLAVITVSTVGFGDIVPETPAGRAVAGVLVLTGIGLFFAVASEIAGQMADGRLQAALRRQRMKRRIESLVDHVVVCGFGRMGRRVTEELRAHGTPVVVVDRDDDAIHLEEEPDSFLVGDATHDDVLEAAGIRRAAGLVACLSADAENVFVTLAARSLGADGLAVVARAFAPDSLDKLRRAGADRVISPFEVVGPWLARAVSHPAQHDFMEVLTGTGVQSASPIVEWPVGEGTPAGQSLRESGIRERTGAIVVAVRRQGKTMINPDADFVLAKGDLVFLLKQEDKD